MINLLKIKFPEELFGDKASEVPIKFRELAKRYHPDSGGSKELFQILNSFHEEALKKIAAGTYGQKNIFKPIKVKTKSKEYVFDSILASGDIADVYANQEFAIKIVRSPANNDLMRNEIEKLKQFETAPTKDLKVNVHISKLIDSCEIKDAAGRIRQAAIFTRLKDFYTLEEVKERIPNGILLVHAAWMFNRLLGALLLAHQNNVIHGAVIPSNFMVCPETHNGVLIDWSNSCAAEVPIKSISPKFKSFYPPEVFDKKSGPQTDIYMAAKCFEYIVGGLDKLSNNKIRGLFKACLLGFNHRTDDVFELFEDFKKLLKEEFGDPKFVKFELPK